MGYALRFTLPWEDTNMTQVSTNGYKSGSNLERMLAAGHFAVTGELGPPKSHDAEVIRKKTTLLKGYVDAANITDNQTAIVRMSSIAAGVILVQEGLEPIIQMTCRDRNRLAMQSDLLGAAALGIKNVLCLSGDHQSFGNHPTAKNVHDIDSLQLVHMVKDLRDEGKFQCGEEIKGSGPCFFIGAAANPFGDPFDWRPYRLAKKVAAGADFIQTQLIYDIPRFKEYMKRVVDMGLHEKVAILAGVGPLKSSGMARYMRDKVPGMIVADEYVDRMTAAVKGIDKEDKKARSAAWRSEGIKICVEQIQQMREIEGVAGVHIMAIEWEEAIQPIVEGAGLLPRPAVNGG
jgi:methylenetetrahydrofolate reductase (NADPH)